MKKILNLFVSFEENVVEVEVVNFDEYEYVEMMNEKFVKSRKRSVSFVVDKFKEIVEENKNLFDEELIEDLNEKLKKFDIKLLIVMTNSVKMCGYSIGWTIERDLNLSVVFEM